MDEPLYYVLLEGRRVGPYDRRTVVGMRIKGMLTSSHAVETTQGVRLSVADLLSARGATDTGGFQAERSGSFSLVHATYAATLLRVQGKGWPVPRFRGEVEARFQADVLRMAGRFRQGLRWKEDRIKLPLKDVVHARVRAATVDLWLRHPEATELQRITLDLGTHDVAGEFVEWLTTATPWPEADSQPAALPPRTPGRGLWVAAAAGTLVLVVLVLTVVFTRRLY